MIAPRPLLFLVLALAAILSPALRAQRQMESLGRGLIALRSNSTQTYVGWRLLGNDPQDLAFNLYRSANGGAPVKVNASPITTTTNYVDTPPNLGTTAYTYTVHPVLNGVEVADSWAHPSSAGATLPANASTRQYVPVPMQPTPDDAAAGVSYGVKFCWVGDLDGDGEYDFVVDRTNPSVEAKQWVQAYKRDGTLLWQMDMGPNSVDHYNITPGSSAIGIGHGDNLTVYDLDGDGRAEVVIRTANGVVFANGTTLSAPDNEIQYVSIIDGITGAEKARAVLPVPANWETRTSLNGHMGIVYADGLRPSLFFSGSNRNPSGSFNKVAATWDFRDGLLTQRWVWPHSGHTAEGHQIRLADVNNDGTDEYVDVGHIVKADGSGQINEDVLTEVVHGDRFHVTDIDPERPGLETYLIQQNNPGGLATAYHSADKSSVIKKLYASSVIDVGRGTIGGFVPSLTGLQMFSTFGGTYDAKGNQLYTSAPFPPETIWWDGDLGREFLSTIGSSATSPGIDKFNTANASSSRVLSLYSDPQAPNSPYNNYIAYGGRPQFWGDILGDWREELLCVATDNSELRIYTTRTPDVAKTGGGLPFRIYTLMHNPQYRIQATTKGYVQSSYTDYYLGYGMTPPPPPPMADAKLVWKGGSGASTWDAGSTSAWKNSATSASATFAAGDTVRFDLSGDNSGVVALSGSLQPGALAVYSPKDYIFSGPGVLSGSMKLTKAGAGELVLSGNHTFTGATTIWDGALRVDGALSASPVTVWGGTWGGAAANGLTGGRLSGSGSVAQPVTARYRGAITPGAGMNAAGTLTLGAGLSALDGSVLAFDLSTDPTGAISTNDRLAITGNLSLSGKVALIINPLGAHLSPGSYTLATYTGSLSGALSNLAVSIPEGTPYTLSLASGALILHVPVTRSADSVVWTGATNGAWDLSTTSNWSLDGAPDVFVSGDAVTFDDAGAARPNVTLAVSAPVAGVTVAGSTNYTFSGSGAIAGNGGLVKSGNGTLTLNTANTFTGPVFVTGGVLALNNLADGGLPSSIGASDSSAANLLLDGATLRLTALQTNTNRNFTVGPNDATLDIPSGSLVQLSGSATGSGSLSKTGTGTLIVANANTHAGGTVLEAGLLSLASDEANDNGPGAGGFTLKGGTLRMYNDTGSYNTSYWPLVIPAGAEARFEADGRSTLAGTLAGSGILTFYTPYIRTDISGNWSAFSGTLKVVTDSDGGDFRIAAGFGFAAATLDLGANTGTYYTPTTGSSGTTIAVGALSGSASTAIVYGGPTGGRTLTWQIGAKNTDTTFAGSIRNSGGTTALTKVGAGALTLTGNNTYTGATAVSAGKLVLSGGALSSANVTVSSGAAFGGRGSIAGNVTFGTGSTLLANPAGPLAITGNLTFSGAVTVAPAPGASLTPGTYQLYTYTGTLTGTPAFAWSGPGYVATFDTSVAGQVSYTLSADTGRAVSTLAWTGAASSTWNSSALNWTYSGGVTAFKDGDSVLLDDSATPVSLTLSGALRPASVTVSASKNYTLSGAGSLSGDASLLKSGTGTLTVSAANSHLGGTTLQSGTLVLGNASALGVGTLTLAGGTLETGALAISNFIHVTGDAIISGGSSGGSHGLTGTLAGSADNLVLTTTSVFDLEGNVTPFSGRISLAGTGLFRLYGSAGSAFAEWNLGVRTLEGRSGSSYALGALRGSTGAVLTNSTSNTGNVTFTVGALGNDSAFAGIVTNGNSTRTTALVKTGPGVLTLSGNSTYTGATTVSAGSLLVTGRVGNSTVSVATGATIGGTGELGAALTLAAGTRLALGVGASATKGPAITGNVTLEGGVTVVPALLGGSLAPGTYPIFTYTGTLVGTPSFSWLDTTGSGYAATFDTGIAGRVNITLVAPPAAPASLSAVAGNARVDLSWPAASGATGYDVLRSTSSGSGYASITTGLATTTYADTTVGNGVTYHYVVVATNLAGTSPASPQASATPRLPAPANVAADAGNAHVTLTWSAVPGATGYRVLRSATAGGGHGQVGGDLTATTFTDTGLTNGSTYYYLVTATDAGGPGLPSTEVSATPVQPLSQVDQWRLDHFGSTDATEDAADNADPDGDGLVNLLEYALGTDPTATSSTPVTLSTASSTLTLNFTRIADGSLTYTVQGTTDLATWTDLWTSTGAQNTSGPVTVPDTAPVSTFTRRFLRLRVSVVTP